MQTYKMHLKITILFAISSCLAGVLAGNEAPTVKTPLGIVEGIHALSYDGRKFSAFYGIPYAEPPLGKHRFKDPVYREQWSGVWKANNTYTCTQMIPETDNRHFVGQEDCLYLNVFVPKEKPNKNDKIDVLVHIHGGAFMVGTQDMFAGPGFLMDADIIFVTMNYRVGPFGFLSTESDLISGNMGLKDQTLALRWIKDNIASFGGNPNSVTITGLSAGGASVHYHYLSPLSKGLFNRGISTSGTVLSPWAFQQRPLENTKKLAINLGCLDGNLDKHYVDMKPIVKCMRQRSSRQILDALLPFYTYRNMPFAPFAPSIEKKRDTAFLTDLPYKLLQTPGAVADLPWITSLATEEGIFPAGYFYEKLDEIEERWNEVIPKILEFERSVSPSKRDSISQKLREYYLKDEPLTKSNFKDFIQMNSDRHFAISTEKAAKMQAQINKENVYFYKFGYHGKYGMSDYFGLKDNLGTCHGDDAFYLFTTAMNSGEQTKDDIQMKDIMVNMFVGFSKSGYIQSCQPRTVDSNLSEVINTGINKIVAMERNKESTLIVSVIVRLATGSITHAYDIGDNECQLYPTRERYILYSSCLDAPQSTLQSPSVGSIKWPALSKDRFYYVLIEGPLKATIDNMENSEKLYPSFWDDLPIEENEKHKFRQARDEL